MTRTVLLGDLINIRSGKSRPKEEGDFPVYGGNGVFDSAPTPNMNEPAIIVGRVGAYCGSVYIEKEPFWLSDNALGVTAKEGSDLRFLYYLLKSINLNNKSVGGAQPLLTQGILNSISVTLPSFEAQKKIADVLGTIDEKIELNRKMNETLEQMGQALFRHYFIDNPDAEKAILSDFVKHLKTSVNPRKNPAVMFSQYSIPAYDSSLTPERSNGFEIKSGKYEVVANSILVSKLNPATPRIWAVFEPKDNSVCSTEFQVIKPKEFFAFAYFLLTSKEYTDKMTMSAGGTSNSHRRVKPDDILGYSFAKPKVEALVTFEKDAITWLRMIDANREQIQTLTTLRDALLPRLINGKVKA